MKYLVNFLLLLLTINISTAFDFRPNERKIIEFFQQEPFESFRSKYPVCVNDLITLFVDAIKSELWALQVLDASGKFQSGYLYGTIFMLGNYDECLNAYKNTSNHLIKGQYCTLLLSPNDNNNLIQNIININKLMDFLKIQTTEELYGVLSTYKFNYGLCVPHSCTPESLNDLWKSIGAHFNTNAVEVEAYDVLCDYQGKPILPFRVDFWIFLFFIIILIMVVLSTFYDLFTRNNFHTNMKKILSTKSDENCLSCLAGIKTICMLSVLLGHRFLTNAFSPSTNGVHIIEWSTSTQMLPIILAQLAVDGFLTISGILLIYTKLNYSKTKKITIANLFVYRLIRLLPPLFATICFHIAVLKHLGQGPFWRAIMQKAANVCYHTWWMTLLQLSNFLNITDQCLEQSWYLSVDSQLYFLSPIILFNIDKYPKGTFFGIIFALLSSMTYAFTMTMKYNLGSSLRNLSLDYLNTLYYPTFVRMPPWLVGIITGYFINNCRKYNFRLSKSKNLILWSIFTCLFFGIIFYQLSFLKHSTTTLHSAIFNGFGRHIWSITISWIVFACATSHGGVVNEFLSLPIFRILERLSYSMFLVNVGVLYVLGGNLRTFGHFTTLNIYHDFFGDIICTLICALVLCLCFESPCLALLKIFTKNRESRKRQKTVEFYDKNVMD